MSRYSESYEECYQRRREEERQYHRDVEYEVWRGGGNMDHVDYDRVSDNFYNGVDAESAASQELRQQQPKQPEYDPEQDITNPYWQE